MSKLSELFSFDDDGRLLGRWSNLKKSPFIHSILLGVLILLASFMWASATQAQAELAYFRPIRTIDTKELGVLAPVGLTFMPEMYALLTVEQNSVAHSEAAQSQLTWIGLRQEIKGTTSASLNFNPINMTFDAYTKQLLILDDKQQELITVTTDSTGALEFAVASHAEISRYGLQDPQGMALSTSTGWLFILDRATSRIVRIQPDKNGSFDGEVALRDGRIAYLPLSETDITAPQGLAHNPQNGHLYLWSSETNLLHELSESGRLVATRDLSSLNLRTVSGLTFAPTGDLTDDPAQMNLYVAHNSYGDDANSSLHSGRIVEISLTAPSTLELMGNPITLVLVQTTETSQWSPPSPDPSGLAYRPSTNTLLIGDSEVEEMPIFEGKNVFESTTSGTIVNTFNILSYSREPAGMAVNTSNNHVFVSDDDQHKVFEVNPGPDGTFGTIDDTTTSFSTAAFDCDDPEGLAFDSAHQILYIADGVNAEIYQVLPGANGIFDGVAPAGDDQVSSFDTAVLGQPDPEGLEFNPEHDTLYIVSSHAGQVIETTPSGTVLNVLDISFLNAIGPAGLAYGPGSENPAINNLYMVDRGLDNNPYPNENDGKLYELTGLPTVVPTPTPTGTPPTPTPTNTAMPPSNPLTFFPNADARVEAANPATNYGLATTLKVDLSPDVNSYLRFVVTGVPGTVAQAKLRLFTISSTSNGPTVHSANNNWLETEINWNNRPATTSGAVDNAGVIPSGVWVEFNVAPLITGDGVYTFLLKPESTSGINFSSREGSNRPQLVVNWVATPTPTSSPTPTPTNTAVPTNTPTATATHTPLPSNTPTQTPTHTATPTHTLTPTPTNTAVPTNTPTATATDTPIPSNTPTQTPTHTATPTHTLTPTPTNTPLPTNTPTHTPTYTPTPTDLPTHTPTPTETAVSTDTPTATPTETVVPTYTPIPTETAVPSHTPAPTETVIPGDTPDPTETIMPSSTPTPTATAVPTHTPTTTAQPTHTPTATPTQTIVPTAEPTETLPTATPTETAVPTHTPTTIPQPTHTPTVAPTDEPTVPPLPTSPPVPTLAYKLYLPTVMMPES